MIAAILNSCSLPPRGTTGTVCPILKPWLEAVCSSTPTSWGPWGHVPETRVSGLKREGPFVLNARPGAPPWVIVLPFEPTNCAWSPIPPSAAATSGRACTRASVESGNDGAFWEPPKASLPVTTASDPEYAVE